MTMCSMRLTVLLASAIAGACGAPQPGADARVAELEKQLAESQKQLADASQLAARAETTPAAAPAAPIRKPASPAKPTSPPESQKYVTTKQATRVKEETQRIIEQQQAVNAQHAATISELKEKLEELKPKEYTLPAGTIIPVRTSEELSTDRLSNGSTFDALLDRDLEWDDVVIARSGARVTGVVVDSDPGGRVKEVASLTVGVRALVGAQNNVIALKTDTFSVDASSTKKRDAVRTGVATGVGALIGGLAGGGKGAAIGAGVGVATGVGVNAATRGEAAVIPSEALMEFRLVAPVRIVIQPQPPAPSESTVRWRDQRGR